MSLKPSSLRPIIKKSWRLLLLLLGLLLAWQALRAANWGEVWNLLAGMGPLAILALAAINVLLLPVMTARWWLLLQTLDLPVGLLPLTAYRITANALSYLSPGPHFGGEPLAVYLLHRRHGHALSAAATTVAVDRLLELLASLVVLVCCLAYLAIVEAGLPSGGRTLLIIVFFTAPFVWLLWALFTGKKPFSRFVLLAGPCCIGYIPFFTGNSGSLTDYLVQGESLAESLYADHRRRFLLANLLSLVHWSGVFVEFWLMSFFLGFPLSFPHLAVLVVVARLAFFTPLPAGIGVLETALPWLTAALGQGSSLGLGLCLIIRFRDLLFSLAGLGLLMKYLTCRGKIVIINSASKASVRVDPLE